MTIYAGEEIMISSTTTDFRGGDLLGPNRINSVGLELFDPALEPLEEGPMTWDVNEDIWYYMWDTAGLDPGTYRAKVTAVGIDGTLSWEFKRIRLARNPIP